MRTHGILWEATMGFPYTIPWGSYRVRVGVRGSRGKKYYLWKLVGTRGTTLDVGSRERGSCHMFNGNLQIVQVTRAFRPWILQGFWRISWELRWDFYCGKSQGTRDIPRNSAGWQLGRRGNPWDPGEWIPWEQAGSYLASPEILRDATGSRGKSCGMPWDAIP